MNIISLLTFSCLAIGIGSEAFSSTGCFRAAVLDQVRQVDYSSKQRTIELNLEMYERSVKLAKENV